MKLRLQTIAIAVIGVCICRLHAQQANPLRVKETAEQHFFSTMATAVKGGNVQRTRTVGRDAEKLVRRDGKAAEPEQTDSRLEGGVLVGFDVWMGKFGNNEVIGGICPIFQTAGGRVRGAQHGECGGVPTTVEAKNGFAVSGIRTYGTLSVGGFEVSFMPIRYSTLQLESAGAYKSQWVGEKPDPGKKMENLVSNQNPIVGIFTRKDPGPRSGKRGQQLETLGLLYYDANGPKEVGVLKVPAADTGDLTAQEKDVVDFVIVQSFTWSYLIRYQRTPELAPELKKLSEKYKLPRNLGLQSDLAFDGTITEKLRFILTSPAKYEILLGPGKAGVAFGKVKVESGTKLSVNGSAYTFKAGVWKRD